MSINRKHVINVVAFIVGFMLAPAAVVIGGVILGVIPI